VKRAGSNPIIFFPDRVTTPQIPEGWTTIVADDDDRYEANFVKVAVNVARRPGEEDNVLPSILFRWFGENAGAPGTSHLVAFDLRDDVWHMSTAAREDSAGRAQRWGHYLRQDIPPLFGLTFSQALWNAGFLRQGNHIFLLVTLEKKGLQDSHQYEDRFLSPALFQWQSQNRTRQDSAAGQALMNHKQNGNEVHLFDATGRAYHVG